MVDVIQWLNPLETMAESLEQPNPVAVPECSFSSQGGRNIIVDGQTARWNSVVSGGRVVVDKPIFPGKELKLSFDGKGHAEVGILTKDPASIPDINQVENLKELTVIQSARIYKQTGTANIKRSICGSEIITEAVKSSSVKVGRTDRIWVTVNIIFGDLEVDIETEGYNFSKESGGNINLRHYDKWANLNASNPCAVCFIEHPIGRKEALYFQIDPILRDDKPSSNFSIKIAISQSNPVDIVTGNDTYFDITSLPVIHFDEFPQKYKKREIQIGLSENGTVQINYEKGSLNKETNHKHIYCIFEICRVKLNCKGKTVNFSPSVENTEEETEIEAIAVPPRLHNTIFVSPYSEYVPPSPEYVRSKRMLESIRQDAEFISIHSNDFNPAMESRNIIGDVSPLIVRNDSHVNNTAESGSSNNEQSPLVENIALLHNKIEDLNSRLQSIEDTIGNRETGKEAMQQNQFQDLKLEIQAIKQMLSETQPSGQSPKSSKNRTSSRIDECRPEKSLTEVLQTNYVKLVSMINAISLLDLLYESKCISHNECESIGKLFQINKENANRDLLSIIICRDNIDLDHFESLLFKSEQIGVLAVLFPDKYRKKKINQ